MRVLVSSTAGAGHFGPLVPFAAACRRAGHDVVVAAPESFRGTVEAAGFELWPFADAPPEEWGAVMARLPELSFAEANEVVVGEVFAGIDARAALPRLLSAMEQWRPDVVLRETAEFGSYVAAERFAVPQARVGFGLGLLDDLWRPVTAAALAPLRASVGLPDDLHGDRLAASPYLTMVPSSFEDPSAPGPKAAMRCREPGPGRPSTPLPAWWGDDDRPLVYVTFGSVAATVPAFAGVYQAAVDALRDRPVRLLVTMGQGGDPDALGTLPDNVHVERWARQDDVLAVASVVVCHGGSGTVLGALAAGVPMVVVPLFADQPHNARRVAAVGAGVALERGLLDPDELADGVTATLQDPSYRAGAAAVAEEIRALPPVDEAVAVLEALVTS